MHIKAISNEHLKKEKLKENVTRLYFWAIHSWSCKYFIKTWTNDMFECIIRLTIKIVEESNTGNFCADK